MEGWQSPANRTGLLNQRPRKGAHRFKSCTFRQVWKAMRNGVQPALNTGSWGDSRGFDSPAFLFNGLPNIYIGVFESMLYTVYKTVNLANGKYYFGVHKTEDPDDSYLGSGNYIRRAIVKYGEQGFRKDVLFTYLDPELAFAKEDEIIQCYRGLDPLCMNLRRGGSGGFDWINKNGLAHTSEIQSHAITARHLKERQDPAYAALIGRRIREGQIKRLKQDPDLIKRLADAAKQSVKKALKAWTGNKHTDESRELMSIKKMGNKNNRFGFRWVYNDSLRTSKSIPPDDLSKFLTCGWKLGRKFLVR